MLAQLLTGPVEAFDAHSVLSANHSIPLVDVLNAATSAVPWAILHARTFEHNVLECGNCGERIRVRAVIADPAVATLMDPLGFPQFAAIRCLTIPLAVSFTITPTSARHIAQPVIQCGHGNPFERLRGNNNIH